MFTTVRADELLRAVSVVLFNTLLLSDDECLSPRLPEVQLLSSLFADRAHTLMHALFFLCFFFHYVLQLASGSLYSSVTIIVARA